MSSAGSSPRRLIGACGVLLAVPLAVLGATAAPAQAAQGTTSQAALTCQGQGVDRTAKARYRSEIVIHAPLHTIWNLQTDVEDWPSWQKPAAPMTIKRLDPGPLRKHSRFRATIQLPPNPPAPPGTVVISSTVRQLQHGKCIRWTGPADGPGYHIDGVHVWNFVKVPGGVLVRTEESHSGEQADPNSDMGLEAWLKDLKAAAETRPCS
ncbi:polyketide cyclase /reductase [Actinosynnema sp. ALI-1.44]|uniref:SRPBCC family protein n=1 Tax=Actinosynnema sp. ALI-1.44 TaxID=1933779 RepID=UPI00097CB9D2|nr:SRPBCC family protein [Actinosynnema sp. ALI-1.44]ONI87060.1 polyketide cyclase /reductase [Actinosynnema sp. ALI-1.44]